MQLLLQVRTTDFTHDLRIEVAPQAPMGLLIQELAAFLDQSDSDHGLALYSATTGTGFDPNCPVGDAQLVSGDVVMLGQPPEAAAHPAPNQGWSLDLLSGPLAGHSIVLPDDAAQVSVGGDAPSDVILNDPTVSRLHLQLEIARDTRGITVVPNLAATNEVRVDGVKLLQPGPISQYSLVQVGSSVFSVRPYLRSTQRPPDQLGQLPFNRTPYRTPVVSERPLKVLDSIPTRGEPRRFAWLSMTLPLAGGIAIAAVTGQPSFLLLALLSPLALAANLVEDRRSGRRRFDQDAKDYQARLQQRVADAEQALADERRERLQAAPDLADLARRAELHTIDLWPRGRETPDFLRLRAGLGTLSSKISATVEERGDGDLRGDATRALAGVGWIKTTPVTLDLAEIGTMAVTGEKDLVDRVAASLVLQAATLHSPEDLVIACAVAPHRRLGDHVKWLPHTRTLTSPLAVPHVVADASTWRDLCREAADLAQRRVTHRAERETRWPWLLVVLDEFLAPDRALVARLLDLSPRSGIAVIWLGQSQTQVPRQAATVLECTSSSAAVLVDYRPDTPERISLVLEPLQSMVAERAMQALAPLRDDSGTSETTAIPRVVPLFTALGVDRIVAAAGSKKAGGSQDAGPQQKLKAWLATEWETLRDYSLKTSMGLTASGPFTLDLVADGPHLLIGGTSGAGKSELLVALVAGLLTRHPPEQLNLLFVDYKGGAASAVFAAAPHTVGYVTNLGGNLADRALVSLRAELNRRMTVLEGRAKDLEEMRERFPDEAPPNLVIVVDEFATLVKEVPGFIPGMIDIAQRGRSLGIHLVLATQRPSGAVNDDILANTNARISLRMVDAGDSSAVVGSPVAATIPVPLRGRAVARLGASELVAFQAGFGGAPVRSGDTARPQVEHFGAAMAARPSGFPGVATESKRPVEKREIDEPDNQLDLLLKALSAAAVERQLAEGQSTAVAAQVRKSPPPWRDELPTLVTLQSVLADTEAETGWVAAAGPLRPLGAVLSGKSSKQSWVVPLGLVDDPTHQRQYTAVLDLEEGGGLLVIGARGSGKTSILRLLAASAVSTAPRRAL